MKNNSDIKTMLREAAVLFGITLIAGIILGFIYELTKEPIRIQQEKAIAEACKAVFADASDFKKLDYEVSGSLNLMLDETGVEVTEVYEAKDQSGKLLGYVIGTVSSEGYGGDISIYSGIQMDGTLNDIAFMEISETAGLGMQAPKVLAPQFHDKQGESFQYTKTGAASPTEIDAISGATITTKAVTNAVNGGLLIFRDLTGGGSNE